MEESELSSIPNGWEVRSIGSAAKVVGGGTPSTKNSKYWGGKIPWITPKDLSGYSFRFIGHGERNITEEGLKNSNARMIPTNSILLTTRAPIGYLAISENELTTNQGFHSLIPNSDVSPFFLYYLIKNNIEYLKANSNGSTFGELSGSSLKQLKFAFPKFEEQDEVARILSDLDSKIELNNHMNKTLESIAQTIFKHWFIDFEFPDENGQPYKSSGGEMVHSEIAIIPKGWGVSQLKDLGQIVCGKTPSTRVLEYFGEDYPFIKIPDMRGLVFTEKTETQLSQKGSNLMLNKKLPPLSVCVSCIATPGLVSLTSVDSYTNQQINSIICKDTVSPYYVYFQMKVKRNEIFAKGSSGTATLNLNTGEFSKIQVLMPSQNVMEKFNDLVQPIFNRILSNQRESISLTDTRDQLLPRLLTGKIRVTLEDTNV